MKRDRSECLSLFIYYFYRRQKTFVNKKAIWGVKLWEQQKQ